MSRQYLAVPYSEKDRAKALGARWDPDAKMWYAEKDFDSFFRWSNPDAVARMAKYKADQAAGVIPTPSLPAHKRRKAARPSPKRAAYQAKMREGFPTERTDFSLPDCGCVDVAPWEDCPHTQEAIDPEGAQHIRSILQES